MSYEDAMKIKIKQHREAYEKCIRGKYTMNIRVVRFNHMGLPRSGKTTLQRRLLKLIVNLFFEARKKGVMKQQQPSTGIAEAGGDVLIRAMSLETGIIQSKVWSLLKDLKEEANMLNQFIYHIVNCNPSVDTPVGGHSDLTPSTPNFSVGGIPASPDPLVGGHKISWLKTTEVLLKKADDEGNKMVENKNLEEIFSIFNEVMEGTGWDQFKYIFDDLTLLINTDMGGQAEFLDLQACLVQGPSFNLLYWRLVDQLDSVFNMYYTNEEGVSTENEVSTVTIEEVLFQALSSIASFSGCFSDDDDTPSGDASTLDELKRHFKSAVMVVGTFLDKVSKEEFKEKDKLLQEKIKSTEFYNKDIIKFASEGQLMLAVDNMNGGEDEIDKIKKVLEKVIEKRFKKIPIPAQWLVLSLIIRKMRRRTMSLEECEKLAWKLKIGPKELQHALWFLHHYIGILLYYPELESLMGTVICDIQVLYDSATNLIKNTFTFDKVGQRISEKFREKAQFSLKDVEEATSGHTDDLIPLDKLVDLFKHVNILTPIPPAAPSSGDSTPEPTYFMPCVLKSARASELSVDTKGDSDPAPLMLRYNCGYTPRGIFPAMITNLVSQQREDWQMIENGLRKNRVQFSVFKGEDCDTVTLILHPRYFEIAVSRGENSQTPAESLCAHIRDVIEVTLETVTKRMNYDFSMGYKFGFMCPAHKGREHLCILPNKTAKRMMCLQDPTVNRTFRLDLHHKVWFPERFGHEAAPPVVQPARLCEQDFTRIWEKLHPYPYKWKTISQLLGFTPAELSTIESTPTLLINAPSSYLSAVLSSWLQWAPGDARGSRDYATLDALRTAVNGAGLGLTAQEL